MMKNKIDFVVYFTVENANPNGDPLSGNMPRTDTQNYGLVTDVCIKRKLRNRMQDMGKEIFVKADDRVDDGYKSLEERFNNKFNETILDEEVYKRMCETYQDTRSFGQVITFGKKTKDKKRSIGIRGPVSITMAKSLSPIFVTSMQITKSTNGEAQPEGKKASDTMGMKHFVEYGLYRFTGSINAYFSEKTGFSYEDAEVIKEALESLFVNDSSSARPDGSMEIKKVYWVEHPNKTGVISSAKIASLFACELKEGTENRKYEDYRFIESPEEVKELTDLGAVVKISEGL